MRDSVGYRSYLRSIGTGVLFLSTILVAQASSQVVDASNPPSRELFNTCVSCHTPPLLELPTDRAWLDGILVTA